MADISERVADHYNKLEERGLEERRKSRIFYLRNFNNWIKSMLISDTLQKIKRRSNRQHQLTILDMGCGKGGDLLKWKKGGIDNLVCADIAGTSVEQCENRFNSMWQRNSYQKRNAWEFQAQFITADCTKMRLKPLYKDKNIQFDVVSCQFAFHYCFESAKQVDQMLQNASECLRPGGYFIGTTPDSLEIVKRLKDSDELSYGNEVYRITFEDKEKLKIFGAQYNFHLTEVVDCPEFLVYFPVLVKMAKRHGLELVFKTRFDDYFYECIDHEDHRRRREARQLLGRMQALETYPAFEERDLSSNLSEDYKHAGEEVKKLAKEGDGSRTTRVGTLSLAEWEASTIYVAFAFRKVSGDKSTAGDKDKDKDETLKRPHTDEDDEEKEEEKEEEEKSHKRQKTGGDSSTP